ncbi:putative adhesin [Vannielia sp. SX4]|uniref:putative adhesin n=1 Tax=Vannielia sp. SX4 TaxID=3463852 RepID=UPI004057F9C1
MTTMTAIGHSIYLHKTEGLPATAVAIDGHGRRQFWGENFTVPPGMVVNFYVDRHAWLTIEEQTSSRGRRGDGSPVVYSDGLAGIVGGGGIVRESFGGGQPCPDYELTKDDQMHGAEDIDYLLSGPLENAFCDIVTLRNRSIFKAGTAPKRLSEVIRKLGQAGHHYGEVRCCFCRGTFWDDAKLSGRGFNQSPLNG